MNPPRPVGYPPPQHLVIVALGSNLGESKEILDRAIERLQAFSPKPLLRSSLWQSSPVDCPPGSPPFVNAVVAFEPNSGETPESLLTKLQILEKEFGRKSKTVLNEPRPLDLDLIAFGSERLETLSLTLPHPRAHLRKFVLQPLAEIARDMILPGQTKTVSALLKDLQSAEILRKVQP